MRLTKIALAFALFFTTITIDKHLSKDSDGKLVSNWNVAVHMNWGHALESFENY